jgi:CRISPR-associated protein Cmr6
MTMSNTGLLFYKEYFKTLEFKSNGELVENSIQNDSYQSIFKQGFPENIESTEIKNLLSFELETIYPGLLVGSGYNHEVGGQENELKLGFFFDYTSGLPVIPASSIKGVLRNAFTQANGDYIRYIVMDIVKNNKELGMHSKVINLTSENNYVFIKEFIEIVFEGKKEKKYLPIAKRDIFFDAWPLYTHNKTGKFLSNDYITPHKHKSRKELDPFTDPTPLQFLKVLPQVVFQFRFCLTDIGINSKLKLEIFKQIILDLGIGAKTNVGYGQFAIPVESSKDEIYKKKKQTIREHLKDENLNEYKENQSYIATIIDEVEGSYLIKLGNNIIQKRIDNIYNKLEEKKARLEKKGKKFTYKKFSVGDEIEICIHKNLSDHPNQFTVQPKKN